MPSELRGLTCESEGFQGKVMSEIACWWRWMSKADGRTHDTSIPVYENGINRTTSDENKPRRSTSFAPNLRVPYTIINFLFFRQAHDPLYPSHSTIPLKEHEKPSIATRRCRVTHAIPSFRKGCVGGFDPPFRFAVSSADICSRSQTPAQSLNSRLSQGV